MKAYLANPDPDIKVILQRQNKGPRDIVLDPLNYALLPQIFCVTDPDILFNPRMPEDFVARLAAITQLHRVGKAGLALDISNPKSMRQEDFLIDGKLWKIWQWEEQFWQDKIETLADGTNLYRADLDTTFAIYNKEHFDFGYPSRAVRLGGHYTCRHLPWYPDVGLPSEEEAYYRKAASFSYYLRANPSDPNSKPVY